MRTAASSRSALSQRSQPFRKRGIRLSPELSALARSGAHAAVPSSRSPAETQHRHRWPESRDKLPISRTRKRRPLPDRTTIVSPSVTRTTRAVKSGRRGGFGLGFGLGAGLAPPQGQGSESHSLPSPSASRRSGSEPGPADRPKITVRVALIREIRTVAIRRPRNRGRAQCRCRAPRRPGGQRAPRPARLVAATTGR